MGAQNTKERNVSVGTHSIRTTRNRPRTTKDGRQPISNIFTEHSGMNYFYFSLSIPNQTLFNTLLDIAKVSLITYLRNLHK